ncbi:syringomycin synthesis regulator SyrP [Burkholderia singularis]|uniref:Syringomycin synthesis regulator SyrP n=1 Tax=Burkholderia singularis TaxID=1503053 RepID=A0A103DZW0_9BURK|nr:TauD/TfdA family dioxygenase [Burkholderia singularis]KVE25768.1 syringomycin synthesis regulator SyrP [Burkholderia singularis]
MPTPAPLAGGAAALFDDDRVVCAPLVEHAALPLCITPRDPALAASPDAFAAWYGARLADIDRLLDAHGALLWRGFAVPDTAAFGRLGALYPPHANGYTAGAAPRRQIAGEVYESTRMPPPFKIGLHQEMAYMPAFPRLVAFYCRRPADAGGETPICDMRRVTARIPAALRERFAARGVMYLRNFAAPGERAASSNRPGMAFGEYHRPWDDAFGTAERADVERLCAARGLGCRWLDDGSVTVSHVGPALRTHPRTGDVLWFNQASAQHPNPRSMGDFSYRQLQRVFGGRAAFPYEVRYGDGTPMPFDDLVPIYDAFDSEEIAFPWQAGDVLVVDNMLVAHGRNPYRGARDTQVMLFD